ncbi:MAG: YbhB/YbcL family Raf kinase inhibitor-like protein [bacterium]
MQIYSKDFSSGGKISKEFTCDGEDKMPSLEVSGVPEAAKSLVLIIDDPDAPNGVWTHFIAWNILIPSDEGNFEISNFPQMGKTSDGSVGYHGPCPPSGTHRYFFRIFALDVLLSLPNGSSRQDLDRATQGHILEKAEIFGAYARDK